MMLWAGYALLFAAAWGMSWLISARLPSLLDGLGAFDKKTLPAKRHTAGGVAIIAPALVILSVAALFNPLAFSLPREQLFALLVSFAMIAGVGLYDDLRGASPLVKLVGQAAAVLPLIAAGVGIPAITNPLSGPVAAGGWSYLILFVWILLITNSINLIDGIDGLASGISLIGAITLFVIARLFGEDALASFAAILAGGIAGFIRMNLPPARIFLGDTGSLFLGFFLAAVSLLERRKGSAAITLLAPVVILAIPLLDTALAVFRRILRGQNPMRGDAEHLHHRLLNLGLTAPQINRIFFMVTAWLGVTAGILAFFSQETTVAVLIILGLGILIALEALRIFEQRRHPPENNPRKTVDGAGGRR